MKKRETINTDNTHLSAKQVTELLGITPATLYAYVSRGYIRSEEQPNSRSKRYSKEDAMALLERREFRKTPEQVLARSLDWGAPILDSQISLIQNGCFYYRGENAVSLSQTKNFEAVLHLLWQNQLADWSTVIADLPNSLIAIKPTETSQLLDAQRALLNLAECEPRSWDLSSEGVCKSGLRILAILTQIFVGDYPQAQGIANSLQAYWLPQNPESVAIFDQALILCAEHELNISSFTVRCAASAGCHPVQAFLAGLACFSGSRHGGAWARVEAMLQECERAPSLAIALQERLERGEAFYGFGHPLYPQGDPRWQAIEAGLKPFFGSRPQQAQFIQSVIFQVQALTGEKPSLDFALVALCRILDLPLSCAPRIFALGRAGGWIAHLAEEYALKRLIRPRARYTGTLPQAAKDNCTSEVNPVQ
jgi:citrate synthase